MSSTNERLDDSRCIENLVYKERMEEYTFLLFFSKSGPERCRLKESVGNSAWCELILLLCGVQRSPLFF